MTGVRTDLEEEPVRKKNGRKAAKLQRIALALSLVCLLYGLISNVVMDVKLQTLEREMETLEEVLLKSSEKELKAQKENSKSLEKETQAQKENPKSLEKEMEAQRQTPKSQEKEPSRKDTAPKTEAPAAETKPTEPEQTETMGEETFREQPRDTEWKQDRAVLSVTLQEGLKPEKVEWEYKKPEDKSWTPVTNNEKLESTNEEPGKYVLRIKDSSFIAAQFHCVITVDGRMLYSNVARVTTPDAEG